MTEIEIEPAVLEDIKNFAVNKAKYFVPEVNGDLKKSIYGKVEGNEVIIGSNLDYSGFVEFGTRQMVQAHGRHDPLNPVTKWKAKTDRGDDGTPQQMPFLRPALYVTAKKLNTFIPEELLVNVEIVVK
jgi:phage gpG-like protein